MRLLDNTNDRAMDYIRMVEEDLRRPIRSSDLQDRCKQAVRSAAADLETPPDSPIWAWVAPCDSFPCAKKSAAYIEHWEPRLASRYSAETLSATEWGILADACTKEARRQCGSYLRNLASMLAHCARLVDEDEGSPRARNAAWASADAMHLGLTAAGCGRRVAANIYYDWVEVIDAVRKA